MPGITTQWNSAHTAMRVHPVDYAFHMLADEHVDYDKKNYLKILPELIDISQYDLPDKYVVFPIGAVAKVKEMPLATLEMLVFYIKQKGYVPVYIGNTAITSGVHGVKIESKLSAINTKSGIDLTNRTNLLQSAAIMHKARAVVGMDGGSIHLAGCTDVPIVVGYTFIDGKRHNVPIRNNILGHNTYVVEPSEDLKCRFCQTNMNFLPVGKDFRNCYYGDFLCVKHMTPDKFIKHLERIL